MPVIGDDAALNRAVSARSNAEVTVAQAFRAWNVPESRPEVLGDVAGLHVVELGCGNAYFSAGSPPYRPGRTTS